MSFTELKMKTHSNLLSFKYLINTKFLCAQFIVAFKDFFSKRKKYQLSKTLPKIILDAVEVRSDNCR